VRIISEAIWPDRTDEESLACVEQEALIKRFTSEWIAMGAMFH